jgi:GxxExxY protein
LSRQVIGCAIEVHKVLGCGFLETVYESALAMELEYLALSFHRQCPIMIRYKKREVGSYFADFIIENRLIVELKAASRIAPIHEAQLINYLAATGIPVGLILNFGARSLQVRRLVHNFDDATVI